MNGDPMCVICTKAPAEQGFLCLGHFARFSSMLRAIEDETAMLDAQPSMAQRTGSGGGSLASERAPARLSVLAYLDRRTKRWEPEETPRYTPPAPKSFGPWCLFCEHETCTAWRAGRRRDLHDDEQDAGSASLASVLEELHNWARLVREERDLAPPDQITVMSERSLLTRHLDWVASEPWVDECYRDIRTILSQLQAVNHTAPDKPVGRCYLPTSDGVCDGPVWVDDAAGHAHCGRCKASWDGPYLLTLKYEMDKAKAEAKAEAARPKLSDGRRMLTAQELADKHKTSVNAIRIRLSRIGAKALQGHYDPDVLTEKGKAIA